jgi:ABC-type uncharacterized transport system auxiliary subunit
LIILLPACISLPGSDSPAAARYRLPGPDDGCTRGDALLGLSVTRVAPGLATDRIALEDAASGEVTYLRKLRWVDTAGAMLEQRLAADLECRGRVVQIGHRPRSDQDHLQCEVRSLNLLRDASGNRAAVALSCFYRDSAGAEQTLLPSAEVAVTTWNGDAAIQALGRAYLEVFEVLATGLRRAPGE